MAPAPGARVLNQTIRSQILLPVCLCRSQSLSQSQSQPHRIVSPLRPVERVVYLHPLVLGRFFAPIHVHVYVHVYLHVDVHVHVHVDVRVQLRVLWYSSAEAVLW